MIHGEPPRTFYETRAAEMENVCSLQWIPPSMWQLGVLHAFFHNEIIRQRILAAAGSNWEPLAYDQDLHPRLASANSLQEIVEHFDQQSQSLPLLSELFFLANDALVTLYQRAQGSDAEMIRLVVSELPPFEEWQERQFPFWQSPWIYNVNSVQLFYQALTDEVLLNQAAAIERLAHERDEWVLYRGYIGSGYPSTLQNEGTGNHALSFGSTLLGGAFYSLESTALTYAQPETPMPYSFLALRVPFQEMKELFRWGPLHPFLQLLVDGEMFHAHTKIAAQTPDEYLTKPLQGYFMKCNQHCLDPTGYLLQLQLSPQELEERFHGLCERSGHIIRKKL